MIVIVLLTAACATIGAIAFLDLAQDWTELRARERRQRQRAANTDLYGRLDWTHVPTSTDDSENDDIARDFDMKD